MSDSDIKSFVYQIERGQWEKALSIGQFQKVEVTQTFQRPHSVLARCKVIGSQGTAGVYVKRYIPNFPANRNSSPEALRKSVERDFQTHLYWFERFKHKNGFCVVEPLFSLPENHIIVTREVSGQRLYDLLTRAVKWGASKNLQKKLENDFFHIGGWLKALQSFEETEPPESNYSVDELIAYINIRLKKLTGDPRRHFPVKYRDRILHFLESTKPAIPESELRVCFTHSDFSPGNIMVHSDGRITVLDFNKVQKDSYLLDLSRLYHQTGLWSFKPFTTTGPIARFRKKLLEGFAHPAVDKSLLFRFFLIRHTLTHLVTVTRFWRVNPIEKGYNFWVLHKELQLLDQLLTPPG